MNKQANEKNKQENKQINKQIKQNITQNSSVIKKKQNNAYQSKYINLNDGNGETKYQSPC